MVPAREDNYMNAEHPYDPPPLWVRGQALLPSVPRLGTRLVGGIQLTSPFMGAGPRPAALLVARWSVRQPSLSALRGSAAVLA